MKFPADAVVASQVNLSAASGAQVRASTLPFEPRLPSTWPPVDANRPDCQFVCVLERIFKEGMLEEIIAVCKDVRAQNGDLQGRGHVIGVAMMAVLESVSKFAYPALKQCKRIPLYVQNYFPAEYSPISQTISDHYRNGLTHEWFMREVAFLPNYEPLTMQSNGSPIIGLLTFRDALSSSIDRFIAALGRDTELCKTAASRYDYLQKHTRD